MREKETARERKRERKSKRECVSKRESEKEREPARAHACEGETCLPSRPGCRPCGADSFLTPPEYQVRGGSEELDVSGKVKGVRGWEFGVRVHFPWSTKVYSAMCDAGSVPE